MAHVPVALLALWAQVPSGLPVLAVVVSKSISILGGLTCGVQEPGPASPTPMPLAALPPAARDAAAAATATAIAGAPAAGSPPRPPDSAGAEHRCLPVDQPTPNRRLNRAG